MTHSAVLATDPHESAIAAGLRYVRRGGPGIRRVRCGKAFRYLDPQGKPVRDAGELERIRALVIPPAWKDVWICPSKFGHLQAVGRDVKGRRQYRYHPQYRQVRDEAKFGRMIAFSAAVARIRKRVAEDLERPGLPREKVLAALVRLLDTTYVRVGNDEYAQENDSFGLTTLKDHHAKIEGSKVKLRFRGKSGVEHSIELNDRKLARIIRQCRDLPGYELFQYLNDEGEVCRVDSADVNQYVRDITGEDFSAKDFRTWAGTILGARELVASGPCRSEKDGKKKIVEAVKRVAAQLGNRPATCRKYYIHPAIVEAYSEGSLFDAMRRGIEQDEAYQGSGLTPEEYSAVVIVVAYQAKQVTETRQVMRGVRKKREDVAAAA